MSSGTRGRRRGVVLILFALSILVIFGFIGLAFDLGRLYIVRNEAQGYCDAAALAAASLLDGTPGGITAALNAALNGAYLNTTGGWKTYHFQSTAFQNTNIKVEFATFYLPSDPASGDWVELPGTAARYRFVRVTASGQVPMYLSPVLTGQSTATAGAFAVAAQVRKSAFDEGLVPFAPLAHCTVAGGPGSMPRCADTDGDGAYDNLGFVEGLDYALRWGSNVFSQTFKQGELQTGELKTWCQGDVQANKSNPEDTIGQYPYQLLAIWNQNSTLLQTKTGFWSSAQFAGNANAYSEMILGWQSTAVVEGGQLPGFDTSPAQVSSVAKALEDRGKLGDPANIIYAPIIDPVSGVILGFYCFRLYNSYPNNGNLNWCAVYIGSCQAGSGRDAVNQDGVYDIRLVR